MGINKKLLSATAPAPLVTGMKTVIYSGTGLSNERSDVGFQPDLVWIKRRNTAQEHSAYDSTRGVQKVIYPDTNDIQYTETNSLNSFDNDGFTISGGSGLTNGSGNTYVAWCWKAGGSPSSVSNGTNTTAITQSASTETGTSFTQFTASAAVTGNFTHGLGGTPDMVIVKTTTFTDTWFIWHKDLTGSGTNAVRFGTDAEEANIGFWANTAPTSTTVTVANGILVGSQKYLAWCWRKIVGFSAFGTYTGNGGSNPITVDDGGSGFQPDFVMAKPISGTGSWIIIDSTRGVNNELYPNLSAAEHPGSGNSFHSTGFTMKSDGNWNSDTVKYIYAAFKTN
tara:strand:- start:47 stop:1060 length:1014 start_codon:yes stop_codon:yes gene_type:complete